MRTTFPPARDAEQPPKLRHVRRAELPRDTVALARWLIGRYVLRDAPEGLSGGRIVETEAYPPGDLASHAWRGPTPRNAPLYGRHGHAYVYLCYGTAWMLNVSSEDAGVGAGILVRALVPCIGVETMRARRGGVALRDIARGPGRLAQALAIDRALDGVDLCARGPLRLATPRHDATAAKIATSTRIGIAPARHADSPLRYFERDSAFVSGSGALNRG